MTEEMLLPWQKFNNELDRNRQLYEAGAISAETFAAANRKVTEQAGADWGTAGASIAGSIKQIGDAFGKESRSMAMVAKVAGIVQATISMFTGAAKALELPFPANLAAMAQVIATGAGIVAQIKSVQVPAMQTGGSFTVPGSGGPDSKRMMVDVSPGEQVDFWKPGDGTSDPRGGARSTPVEMSVSFGDFVSREFGARLIERINELTSDGYRLKVA